MQDFYTHLGPESFIYGFPGFRYIFSLLCCFESGDPAINAGTDVKNRAVLRSTSLIEALLYNN